MEAIKETQALLKSVSGPELWNDERDGITAKLNQLQAVNGVGTGYYQKEAHDKGLPPIQYTPKNVFYSLKSVVYNRLCENSDEDGIVALFLNVPHAKLNADDGKSKLVSALNQILGPQNFNVIINNIKPSDAQRSEVVLHAYERSRGRLGAMQLYRCFTQPDKMRQLESQLACQKVVPVVALSNADRAKFLNTPPENFHPALWRQFVAANPDPAHFLPQPIYGYEQLIERRQMQHASDKVQQAVLEQNVDRLKRVQNELVDLRSHIQSSKRVQKELSHRLLKVLAHMSMQMRQGYALNRVEDAALAQAERASADLLGPHAIKDRINELLKIVEADRGRIIEYFNNIDVKFTPEEERHLRAQLQITQSRLEKVNDMLVEDKKIMS